MISDPVLTLAVDRGVITARSSGKPAGTGPRGGRGAARSAAAVLPALTSASRDEAAEPDDERLRFVTGFADIFVTLGLGLFFGSAAYLIGLYAGGGPKWAILAVLAWLFAEFFTRRHRMALPSIVLLSLFAVAIFNATFAFTDPGSYSAWLLPSWGTRMWFTDHAPSILAAALMTAAFAGAALLALPRADHHRRRRWCALRCPGRLRQLAAAES